LKLLVFIRDFVNKINNLVGIFVSWLTTLLVLVVCFDVFTRYVMKDSSVAVQELEWHIFALIFLLGAAYTLREDKHVRVDVLYTNFSPKWKAIVNLVGCVVFLLPFSILVIKTSYPFVLNAYAFNECSPDPGGLPYRWLLKSVILVGFVLVFLQGLSMASSSILTIAGHDEEVKNG